MHIGSVHEATRRAYRAPNGRAPIFSRKHEDAVRRAAGEMKYQELSQRYPNYTNATRQRLIGADPEMPVPEEFAEILRWLAP